MAAITPNSVHEDNLGSLRLIRAVFSTTTIADLDTWASGVSGIVDHWFSGQNDPTTQASAGVHVSNSSGTFTFHPGENAATGTLFILARS